MLTPPRPALRLPSIQLPRRRRASRLDPAPSPLPAQVAAHVAPAPADSAGPSTSGAARAEDGWGADDRALAVASALAELCGAQELHSPILALDTAGGIGSGQVRVTLDTHAAEEATLAALPEQFGAIRPGWRARWRSGALVVDVAAEGAPPTGGPLLAPILDHGRRCRTTRFYPLSTWRHVGLYGADAAGALHALLCNLLYIQPPSALALSILDRGAIAPLYRHVAHLVSPPGDAVETVASLVRALRRGTDVAGVRPLLLAVVEPDEALLGALAALVERLRQHPHAPIHLLLAQERLRPAGRELYARLPALITAGGQGPAEWLPGQRAWPRRDAARLACRAMRVEGRARTLDESGAAALLANLAGAPGALPAVLWDMPAPATQPQRAPSVAEAPRVPSAGLPASSQAAREASGDSASAPDAAPATADDPRYAAALGRIEALLAAPPPLPAVIQAASTAPPIQPAPDDEPDNGWPCGPLGLRRSQVAALVRHLLSDAAFTTAPQPDQVGVTKRRLQAVGLRLGLFPEAQARSLSEALMLWLDIAGVLADPLHPNDHRLNQPRALLTADDEWIAARLRATPLPTPDEVRAAFAPAAGGPA